MAVKKPIFTECVKDVLNKLNKLESHSSIHLSSIAKAIEQKNRNISKIILHKLTGEGLGEKGHAMLLTQELSTRSEYDQTNAKLYEHFIFYDVKDITDLHVRFAIAHELGHIFLHNPMKRDKKDRYQVPIKDCEVLFAIRYKPEDEVGADIFATVMCEQRQIPKRENFFTHPCIKYIQDYKEKGYFRTETLDALKDEIQTCVALYFS